MVKGKVLIAEKYPSMYEQRVLRRKGFEVVSTQSPTKARNLLQRMEPDVLVLYAQLAPWGPEPPFRESLATCTRDTGALSRLAKRVGAKVIAMTGYDPIFVTEDPGWFYDGSLDKDSLSGTSARRIGGLKEVRSALGDLTEVLVLQREEDPIYHQWWNEKSTGDLAVDVATRMKNVRGLLKQRDYDIVVVDPRNRSGRYDNSKVELMRRLRRKGTRAIARFPRALDERFFGPDPHRLFSKYLLEKGKCDRVYRGDGTSYGTNARSGILREIQEVAPELGERIAAK